MTKRAKPRSEATTKRKPKAPGKPARPRARAMFSVDLDEDLYRKLDRIAALTNLTVAAVVSVLVTTDLVIRASAKPDAHAARRKAKP